MRISKSIIGKYSDTLVTLEKNIDKLPRTKEYIDSIVEIVEEFQLRRCKKLIDKDTSVDIRLWKLQAQAGIRNKDFQNIKYQVIKYINLKEEKVTNGKR